MSDNALTAIVQVAGAFFSLVGVCFTAYMTYLMRSLDKKASETAVKAAEAAWKVDAVKDALQTSQVKARADASVVKEALAATQAVAAEKLEGIAQTGKMTHVLVNNNMKIQLGLNAELSRWKASQTNDPADVAAADRAEALLAEHEWKQATVDATTTEQQARDAKPDKE